MSQSYTGVKGTPFSDLVFFRRAGKPGFATAGDDRGDKARGTGPRRGPPPRGRMDPEFYVEKPNKLIALTIATLNAGISIGIAASLLSLLRLLLDNKMRTFFPNIGFYQVKVQSQSNTPNATELHALSCCRNYISTHARRPRVALRRAAAAQRAAAAGHAGGPRAADGRRGDEE